MGYSAARNGTPCIAAKPFYFPLGQECMQNHTDREFTP